jgi:hypothetical protein
MVVFVPGANRTVASVGERKISMDAPGFDTLMHIAPRARQSPRSTPGWEMSALNSSTAFPMLSRKESQRRGSDSAVVLWSEIFWATQPIQD